MTVSFLEADPPPPLVPARFMCDDVDFNLRVHSAGLLLCRFNRFSVMKKQIAVGGHRSFHITSKVGVAVCPETAAARGGKAGREATRAPLSQQGGLDGWAVLMRVASWEP